MTDSTKTAIPKISKLDKAIILGNEEYTHDMHGDIRYRAPEVIKGKAYNFKADSYSFGVILYFMLTGAHPFDYYPLTSN